MPPDILKYFHQEPALLEPVTPNHDPDARRREDRSAPPAPSSLPLRDPFDTSDAYRGYLAGTNRTGDRVGLTSLRSPDAYTAPLRTALGGSWWGRCTTQNTVESLAPSEVQRVLRAPANTFVLVTADAEISADPIISVADGARARSALRSLLAVTRAVFFPEPAHHGYDWSFFSAAPMRDRLVSAFRTHPAETVRRFVVPYEKARSESKFYFDTWQLTESSLPNYIKEV